MSIALDCVLLLVGWAHVLIAPYTKVEESFNLHAVHDVLMYGVRPDGLHNFDHFTFPGAVPRTFIGAVLLSWLSTPVIHLASWLHLISEKFDLQILVRLVLASLNAYGLCLLRRAISRRFGRITGLFFTLLTITQFHLPFWMGRTLPNMFALFPFNLASSLLLAGGPATKQRKNGISIAISLLTFTAIVFRAEIALYLGPLALQLLVLKWITFAKLMKIGIVAGIVSLAMTVSADSYFWNSHMLWPEFAGIYFNVYQGKSSEWGTSPRLAYLTTHLPKLLLSSLPLSILGCIVNSRIRTFLVPSFALIALISNLGHKEWRFIIYVVPIFNLAAACGATWLVSYRKSAIIGHIFTLSAIGLVGLNLLLTVPLLLASAENYPGGQALQHFHALYSTNQTPPPSIHICNLAAQTGASLFLQMNSPPFHPALPSPQSHVSARYWAYDKTETLSFHDLTSNTSVTHLIAEENPDTQEWRNVGSVKGFERWEVDWNVLKMVLRGDGRGVTTQKLIKSVRLRSAEKLWILERRGIE